ncbi:MAG: hypothetical protein ACR2QM_11345 [Longimicrobiales bacterium]
MVVPGEGQLERDYPGELPATPSRRLFNMGVLEWTQLPNLEVPTGILGVAEVRNGPGSEILVVRLPEGTFRPCLGINPQDETPGAISAVRVIHESALGGWTSRRTPADVERGGVIGWLSTDLATAGIFDYLTMEDLASGDAEGFDAWREDFYASMDWPNGFASFGGDSRVSLFYAQGSAAAGRLLVSELLVEGEAVGVEVAFAPTLMERVDERQDLVIERMAAAGILVPQGV